MGGIYSPVWPFVLSAFVSLGILSIFFFICFLKKEKKKKEWWYDLIKVRTCEEVLYILNT